MLSPFHPVTLPKARSFLEEYGAEGAVPGASGAKRGMSWKASEHWFHIGQ